MLRFGLVCGLACSLFVVTAAWAEGDDYAARFQKAISAHDDKGSESALAE